VAWGVLFTKETEAALEFDDAFSLSERKSFDHLHVEQELLEPKYWRSLKASDIRRNVVAHVRWPVMQRWVLRHQTRKKFIDKRPTTFVDGQWNSDRKEFNNTKRTANSGLIAVTAGIIEVLKDHLLPFLRAEDKYMFIEMNAILQASSVDPEEAALLETAMLMAKMAKERSKRCEMLARAKCEFLNIELGGKNKDKVLKEQLESLCKYYEMDPVPKSKTARLQALAPKLGLCV
jgi:hypothetical protein